MSISKSLLFFFCVNFLLPSTLQQGTLPPKAINPERLKVMKDALSWMTFRKDGNLATDQDLEPFFEALKTNYVKSKYFRTLVVAFKDGVLPRLALNENADCDPAYTVEYRDPYNNSVTYGQLKKFIFHSYDNDFDYDSTQYCDYRQGLVCNPQTKKCGCPIGSKMGPISQGPSEQRCQLEENEICALIDLDHDPRSKYGALKKVLPEMLFNLEKPLSCKMGTQCRFTDNTQHSPSCYSNSNGGSSWAKGQWILDLGDECTLGLYAGSGPCKVAQQNFDTGIWTGYTCFNFGPLKPAVPTQVGICAHDFGSKSITKNVYGYQSGGFGWDSMFIPFVSPATTSLRGATLRKYYKKYINEVEDSFLQGKANTQSSGRNESCSVAKTQEMLDHWKFFLSLEGTPPAGQDHVATEVELETRLQQIVDLTVDWHKKTCRVYRKYSGKYFLEPALECVADSGFVDANGNDGRCEYTPENEDVTYDWAKKIKEFREHVVAIYYDKGKEDEKYRKELIGGEIDCDPTLGYPPGSEGAPATDPGDNFVLEGGYCAPDRGCYLNYGDYLNIYDSNCNYKGSSGEQGLFRDCQWMDNNRKFGKCEERKLDEEITEELSQFSNPSGLARGDRCDYDFEKRIRDGIKNSKVDGNKYQFLWKFQNIKNGVEGYDDGFCDRTRLLECTTQGTCECIGGTAPRSVEYGGVEYMSDYCYITSDYCHPSRLNSLYAESCVEKEKNAIDKHYRGKQDSSCDGSNWCVYLKIDDYKCTKDNTGNTGFMPELETEKPGGGGGNKPRPPSCKDDPYCNYPDAGKGENQLHESLKMILLVVMIIYFDFDLPINNLI